MTSGNTSSNIACCAVAPRSLEGRCACAHKTQLSAVSATGTLPSLDGGSWRLAAAGAVPEPAAFVADMCPLSSKSFNKRSVAPFLPGSQTLPPLVANLSCRNILVDTCRVPSKPCDEQKRMIRQKYPCRIFSRPPHERRPGPVPCNSPISTGTQRCSRWCFERHVRTLCSEPLYNARESFILGAAILRPLAIRGTTASA